MACRKDIEVVPKKKKTPNKKNCKGGRSNGNPGHVPFCTWCVVTTERITDAGVSSPERHNNAGVKDFIGWHEKKQRLCSFTDRKVLNSKIGCPVNMTSL